MAQLTPDSTRINANLLSAALDSLIPPAREVLPGTGLFHLHDVEWVTVANLGTEPSIMRGLALLQSVTGIQIPQPQQKTAAGPCSAGLSISLDLEPDRVNRPRGRRADGAAPETEQYLLEVGPLGITLRSVGAEGAFRALTTLAQLAASNGTIPFGRIADSPRFAWRGLSLDVARWFVPLPELHRVVDMAAMYKLNVLHLHLTDDQGWRIPVKGWPALTEGELHYTREEFAAFVEYAEERCVSIVPEFDLPGHVGALLAAYPGLKAEVSLVPEGFPFPVGNLDVESDEVWRFVDDAIDTLTSLSPARYVHVGGDESFGMSDQRHADFVTRTAQAAHGRDKRVVGWQESARGQLTADDLVQHWIDFAGDVGVEPDPTEHTTASSLSPETLDFFAATFRKALGDLPRAEGLGTDVILSPTSHVYLDRPHGDPSTDPEQEAIRARLGLQYYPATTLEQFSAWDPDQFMPSFPSDRIAGVEAALWCETVHSELDLELLLLPRLCTVADAAWRSDPTDWATLQRRLTNQPRIWATHAWAWFRANSVPWSTD